MQKFNNFYIHPCEFHQDTLEVFFYYSFDTETYFTETIALNDIFPIRENIDTNTVNNILFHASIAFGISYYKLFPTKNIIVESGTLQEQQCTYWRNFYIQGLGEFFFTNDIDFQNLCFFTSTGTTTHTKKNFPLSEKTLLPIGGGKDSIVSALLLEEQNTENITPFIFGKNDTIKERFLEIYGTKELLIHRKLSPQLFIMNEEGYYNGHVPITGLISFFMTFVCYIYDYKYIVFSNEKSADTGNTLFCNNEINHQYSKSSDFRKDFSQYINAYVSSEIVYSSLLEEYYEIQIAKIFAERGKKYFHVFSSCNKNFSITKKQTVRWCNNCSKCLFVYIILRPFITYEETIEIFGEELYERRDLETLFLEVIGEIGMKPFECVGEVDEAKLAAYMAMNSFTDIPYLLLVFQKRIQDTPVSYFEELKKRYETNI